MEAPDVEEAPTEIVGWTPLKRMSLVANGRESANLDELYDGTRLGIPSSKLATFHSVWRMTLAFHILRVAVAVDDTIGRR